MTSLPALPADLRALFPDGHDPGRVLPVPLPAGRAVLPDEGHGEHPALWLSDAPAPAGLWGRLRAAHRVSGLWPLLLTGLEDDSPARPWGDGELWPADMSSPGEHDPEAVLLEFWTASTEGAAWPGLAPPGRPRADPEAHADAVAEALLGTDTTWHLGLVAAQRGADALAVAGWMGPANHHSDTARLAAVLRSWEERFAARVVGVGFATLVLSVAAPPQDTAEALHVAAEHFAFCPDTIWQGPAPRSLEGHARRIAGADHWRFWWD